MKDYIYELVCGLLFVLFNVATIGTSGNIMTFLKWDDNDRAKFEPVYRSLNLSENCFKWLIAIMNTLLIGIPQGIVATVVLVRRFIYRCKIWKTLNEMNKLMKLLELEKEKKEEAEA